MNGGLVRWKKNYKTQWIPYLRGVPVHLKIMKIIKRLKALTPLVYSSGWMDPLFFVPSTWIRKLATDRFRVQILSEWIYRMPHVWMASALNFMGNSYTIKINIAIKRRINFGFINVSQMINAKFPNVKVDHYIKTNWQVFIK